MRLQFLVVRVDLVFGDVPLHERLFRRHEDARVLRDVGRPDLELLVQVEDPHPPLERLVERCAIRMARLLQRLRRLPPDRVARREPQHKRIIL